LKDTWRIPPAPTGAAAVGPTAGLVLSLLVPGFFSFVAGAAAALLVALALGLLLALLSLGLTVLAVKGAVEDDSSG